MGYKELIESLRKESEERAQRIWREAEDKAEKIKADIQGKIEQISDEFLKKQSRAMKEQTKDMLSEANVRERMIMLSADEALSDRLYSLAIIFLERLRNERYKDVFKMIVWELPSFKWQVVRVNPDDVEIAQEYFPHSEIMPDNDITGGVDVITEDGGIRVINTFKKRLERAWMDMLPLLIKDAYSEIFNKKVPS